MAKKVKRKVSQVSSNGQSVQIKEVTAAGLAPEASIASTSATASGAARSFSRRPTTAQEFNPDYTYVVKDLKRIGTLAGTFFALLIVLYFVLPLIIK